MAHADVIGGGESSGVFGEIVCLPGKVNSERKFNTQNRGHLLMIIFWLRMRPKSIFENVNVCKDVAVILLNLPKSFCECPGGYNGNPNNFSQELKDVLVMKNMLEIKFFKV